MEKRKHFLKKRSVSLSFVLLRFALSMLGCMALCGALWLMGVTLLENTGHVYSGSKGNQQAEQLLAADKEVFHSPGPDFLPEYILLASDGRLLESNADAKAQQDLASLFQQEITEPELSRHTYGDGSTLILRWHFRKEFVNPVLRRTLPPFETLWWVTLCISWILCLLGNTLWLRRQLAQRLRLFQDISRLVGAQELDFQIPKAGIQEFDEALASMDQMRKALYDALSAQWAAQQARESEIAALAHDLKSPLTLISGNAELLLEEALTAENRRIAETILSSSHRARQYVSSLLEISVGSEEPFESYGLPALFDELCEQGIQLSKSRGIQMRTKKELCGTAKLQKERLIRALGNIVQNAVEHTPAGKSITLEGTMRPSGWQITISDEGEGFTPAALRHATERLWRSDTARAADGHQGLGLWFAAQVIEAHAGELTLENAEHGGRVRIFIPFSSRI